MAAETIAIQSERLREGLLWSREITANVNAAVDHHSHRMMELGQLINPVAKRVQTLSAASEKIKAARTWADATLRFLDTARQVEAAVLAGPRANIDSFADAMGRLHGAVTFFDEHQGMLVAERAGPAAKKLRLQGLQLAANEFWMHLCDFSVVPSIARLTQQVGSETETGVADDNDIEAIPPHIVSRLARLVKVMFDAGETSCVKTYVDARRSVSEHTLAALGADYSPKDVYSRLPWPALERKIQMWILLVRAMMRCLVAESRLAAGVFKGDIAQATFSDVVASSLTNLAQFGEAIVLGKRTPEKVFGLLDCHEQLQLYISQFYSILQGTSCEGQLVMFENLNIRMQNETRATFSEFELSIEHDTDRHAGPDGTVHPLTAYTLSFLKRLFTYESSINVLFLEPVCQQPTSISEDPVRQKCTAAAGDLELIQRTSSTIRHILNLLSANLLSKSKTYKSKALSAVFMMNNLHYAVKTVESSEVLAILGEEWLEQHTDQVEDYGEQYQREAWGSLLALLQANQEQGNRDKVAAKETMRRLSLALAEIEDVQSLWAVPDVVLRKNLRDALIEDFLAPYETLLARNAASASRVNDKHIRYQVDDVRALIQESLFEGPDAPQSKPRGAI